jgi:hypothetical protein
MSRGPRITRVSIYQYRTQTQDLGVDYNGFNSVYAPGVLRYAPWVQSINGPQGPIRPDGGAGRVPDAAQGEDR